MTIKRVLQFDAFSLKYLKIGKQSPSPYLKELTLHLESYKRNYWYTMEDYEAACFHDMLASDNASFDLFMYGKIDNNFDTVDELLRLEDIRFNMANITREMILRGEY